MRLTSPLNRRSHRHRRRRKNSSRDAQAERDKIGGMEHPTLRIVPDKSSDLEPPVLERIAIQLKRIADRLEDDATVFNEMVRKGNGLST
jgi:hypothetical protein